MGASEGASDSREIVQASEILAAIERGEPVEYDSVIVEGDLDLSRLDLPVKYVDRTEYEIQMWSLGEEIMVIQSPIKITDSKILGNVNFCNAIIQGQANFEKTNFTGVACFSGSIFSGDVSFYGAEFSGGYASFSGAEFSGGYASFTGAEFSGRYASFGGAEFSGGDASFGEARFSGGDASFYGAEFSGGYASFTGAKFSGGDASFGGAEFSGGYASFTGAEFSGGDAHFGGAEFSGGGATFGEAKFSGGDAYFGGAEFSGGDAYFGGVEFSGGDVFFYGTEFSGGIADFSRSEFSGGDVFFYGTEFSGGDVSFYGTEFSGGDVSFYGAEFSGGDVSFYGAEFSGVVFIEWHSIGKSICDDVTYLFLVKNFRDTGQFESADDCYYDYRKYDMGENFPSRSTLIDFLAWVTCGFGVRPSYTLYWSFGIIFFFGFAFWVGNGIYIYTTQQNEVAHENTWAVSDICDKIFRKVINIIKVIFLLPLTIPMKIFHVAKKMLATSFRLRQSRLLGAFENMRKMSFTTGVSLKDGLYFSSLVFVSQQPQDWRPKEGWKYLVMMEDTLGWLLLALFLVTLGNVMIR